MVSNDTWYLSFAQDELGSNQFFKLAWPTQGIPKDEAGIFGIPPEKLPEISPEYAELEYHYDITQPDAVISYKFNTLQLPDDNQLETIAKEFARQHEGIPLPKTIAFLRVLRDKERKARHEAFDS